MNIQHPKLKLALSIAVVILAAVAFSLALHRKQAVMPSASPLPQKSALDWTTKIPEITAALSAAFPSDGVASREAVTVLQQTDITGDGIPEALVDLGTGGASTDLVSLVQMAGDQVQVAKFKEEDGTVDFIEFPQGAASLHSDAVELSSDLSAIYHGNVSYNADGTLDSCSVDAYEWSAADGIFEYSSGGSSGIEQAFCSNITENAD